MRGTGQRTGDRGKDDAATGCGSLIPLEGGHFVHFWRIWLRMAVKGVGSRGGAGVRVQEADHCLLATDYCPLVHYTTARPDFKLFFAKIGIRSRRLRPTGGSSRGRGRSRRTADARSRSGSLRSGRSRSKRAASTTAPAPVAAERFVGPMLRGGGRAGGEDAPARWARGSASRSAHDVEGEAVAGSPARTCAMFSRCMTTSDRQSVSDHCCLSTRREYTSTPSLVEFGGVADDLDAAAVVTATRFDTVAPGWPGSGLPWVIESANDLTLKA